MPQRSRSSVGWPLSPCHFIGSARTLCHGPSSAGRAAPPPAIPSPASHAASEPNSTALGKAGGSTPQSKERRWGRRCVLCFEDVPVEVRADAKLPPSEGKSLEAAWASAEKATFPTPTCPAPVSSCWREPQKVKRQVAQFRTCRHREFVPRVWRATSASPSDMIVETTHSWGAWMQKSGVPGRRIRLARHPLLRDNVLGRETSGLR